VIQGLYTILKKLLDVAFIPTQEQYSWFYSANFFRRDILSKEFMDVPMSFVDACLAQSGGALFPAYRILDEARQTLHHARPAYRKLVRPRKDYNNDFNDGAVEARIVSDSTRPEAMVLQELQAARRIRRKAEAKREEEHQYELAEAENLARAIAIARISSIGSAEDAHAKTQRLRLESPDIYSNACLWKLAKLGSPLTRGKFAPLLFLYSGSQRSNLTK